eukprot:2342794-Amphidinium_carterae.1
MVADHGAYDKNKSYEEKNRYKEAEQDCIQELKKQDIRLLQLCVRALDFNGTSSPTGNHHCKNDLHNRYWNTHVVITKIGDTPKKQNHLRSSKATTRVTHQQDLRRHSRPGQQK